jgi:hypothetical protein
MSTMSRLGGAQSAPKALFCLLLFAVGIFFIEIPTQAGLDVQTERVTSSLYYELVEDTQIEPNYLGIKYDKTFLKTRINIVDQPLVLQEAGGKGSSPIVERINSFEFLLAVPLSSSFLLSSDLSLSSVEIPDQGSKVSLGDFRVSGKYRPERWQNPWVEIALMPEIYFPTGQEEAFTSNGSFGAGLLLVLQKNFPRMNIAANIGYRSFSQAQYRDINQKNQIPASVGAFLPISQKFAVNVEGSLNSYLNQGGGQSTGDFYAGLRCQFSKNNILSAGVGMASVSSSDTPSYRYLVGLTILPFIDTPPATITLSQESIREIQKMQIIETGTRCEIKTKTIEAFARPLKKSESATLILPYLSTARHPIQDLRLGQMTGVGEGGLPYVKDGQVLFAFDLHHLPIRNSVVQLNTADLKIKVSKISSIGTKKQTTGSEILCFLEPHICSGELIEESSWLANINPLFFHGKETPNDFFARQYLDKEVAKIGGDSLYAAELTLPLKKLLENSRISDPMELLYEKSLPTQKVKLKTIYFSVGNQTYIASDAKLIINLSIDTCANQTPERQTKVISNSEEQVFEKKPPQVLQIEEHHGGKSP